MFVSERGSFVALSETTKAAATTSWDESSMMMGFQHVRQTLPHACRIASVQGTTYRARESMCDVAEYASRPSLRRQSFRYGGGCRIIMGDEASVWKSSTTRLWTTGGDCILLTESTKKWQDHSKAPASSRRRRSSGNDRARTETVPLRRSQSEKSVVDSSQRARASIRVDAATDIHTVDFRRRCPVEKELPPDWSLRSSLSHPSEQPVEPGVRHATGEINSVDKRFERQRPGRLMILVE